MAFLEVWQAASTNCVSGTNAAAVVTLAAAGSAFCNAISGVAVSYSGTPTGGYVKVQNGSAVVFDVDIAAGGPTIIDFGSLLVGSANTAMTITLAAGGSGIVGRLTPLGVAVVPVDSVP